VSAVGEIIDGAAVAEQLKVELAADAGTLTARGIRPGIATVLAGDDYGARMYRRSIELEDASTTTQRLELNG